jgi:hypothetical protein
MPIEVDMTSGCDGDGDMIKDSADDFGISKDCDKLGRESLLELKSERDGLSWNTELELNINDELLGCKLTLETDIGIDCDITVNSDKLGSTSTLKNADVLDASGGVWLG